jgi:hypothetical protein
MLLLIAICVDSSAPLDSLCARVMRVQSHFFRFSNGGALFSSSRLGAEEASNELSKIAASSVKDAALPFALPAGA